MIRTAGLLHIVMKFAMRETKAVFAVTPTTATDLNALSVGVLALALAQTQSL